MRHLPPGVGRAAQGQEQAYAQLFIGFIIAIASAIGLVYSVMVLLFRSFFKPFVILSALPTAIGGALLALLVTDLSLSIPSLIGFLMLMGLAAKNSILLVEYAIERERDGATQREALIEACRERARPIVMTTLAMMAGMLPTALTLGKGSEFRQPMAVAVIGGLITSTSCRWCWCRWSMRSSTISSAGWPRASAAWSRPASPPRPPHRPTGWLSSLGPAPRPV